MTLFRFFFVSMITSFIVSKDKSLELSVVSKMCRLVSLRDFTISLVCVSLSENIILSIPLAILQQFLWISAGARKVLTLLTSSPLLHSTGIKRDRRSEISWSHESSLFFIVFLRYRMSKFCIVYCYRYFIIS